MQVSAILLVGMSSAERATFRSAALKPEMMADSYIACTEVLGESILDRKIKRLRTAGVGAISVIADACLSELIPSLASRPASARPSIDPWLAADRTLREYADSGVENVLVVRLGAYAEIDFRDLMQFHREQDRMVTHVHDPRGPLDCWVVNLAKFRQDGMKPRVSALRASVSQNAPYVVHGYVNRLSDARDLRRLIVDSFLSRCAIVPGGQEVRPGVWVDNGARIHRRARIVAPAYIGRNANVRAFALITRFSTLESGCDVDCGSAVEDSSLLANTYIGPGLDVRHAVVSGGTFAHLTHGVTVQIDDCKLVASKDRRRHQGGNGVSSGSGASMGGLMARSWTRQVLSMTRAWA